MSEIIKYTHHGHEVFVDMKLMGKHRDHCLCFRCKKLCPKTIADMEMNHHCEIANKLFAICVEHNLVTAVWECPLFLEK